MKTLAIKDVAEQTGLAPGTIRMWEQRYGYPEPARTPAGYRVYTDEDVVTLRRVLALRDRGLSVPAALEQARDGGTDRVSLFAALSDAPVRPQRLRKRTLVALSRAIEDEAIASAAGPVVIAAFQDEANYRAVEHRYRRIAKVADAVLVFARFASVHAGEEDEPVELPIGEGDPLGHEWAVVIDAPGYAACLVGWETPREGEREFEAVWTMDPAVVRRAAHVGAALASRVFGPAGGRVQELLVDRPLAVDHPAPALTALTNRMISYLER